jgi:hypothetical protein
MATPRNGFIRSRTLTGKRPVLRQFQVNVDSNSAYFAGDPVVLLSTGKVALCTASSSANFAGVIESVGLIGPSGEFQQLTFNQPTRGPYLTSGQTGYAMVNVDPETCYIAQLDVTASVGLVGQTVSVSGGTPNTRAGISGFNLRGASLGTGAEGAFKIVGIAPTETINGLNKDYPAGSGVEVIPNPGANIFWKSTGV